MKYACLLRGVNVGGKNKVSMTELRTALEADGFTKVSTFINSGNVFVGSDLSGREVEKRLEAVIIRSFKLDSDLIKVRALTPAELQRIVQQAPAGFGAEPETYHSDVLFPMDGATSADVMTVTETNPEVDKAWEANGVVYYQRLSSLRTKSRLSKVISQPVYKNVTIRSWSTTQKLLSLL